MPKSPGEADSEKTGGGGGIGVNLEARPAENGANHSPETNASTSNKEDSAQAKEAEGNEGAAVDPKT